MLEQQTTDSITWVTLTCLIKIIVGYIRNASLLKRLTASTGFRPDNRRIILKNTKSLYLHRYVGLAHIHFPSKCIIKADKPSKADLFSCQ